MSVYNDVKKHPMYKDALCWWDKKTLSEQMDIAKRYYPMYNFCSLSTSTHLIIEIYIDHLAKGK